MTRARLPCRIFDWMAALGQFGGLIVHELALVRRVSPDRRAVPGLAIASGRPRGVLRPRRRDRPALRVVIGPVFGEEAPDLAQQRDLLGIGLDLALQAVEQIEQPAPVLGCPQELRQRHERLHRLEIDDVGLLADDLAGGLRRHVEKADVLADKLACPFHGREPPPPGAGLHQQERRTDDGFVRSPSSICDSASLTRGAFRASTGSAATAVLVLRGHADAGRAVGAEEGVLHRRIAQVAIEIPRGGGHGGRPVLHRRHRTIVVARRAVRPHHVGHALERPQEGVEIRHRPALRPLRMHGPPHGRAGGRHHRRNERDARRFRRRRREPRRSFSTALNGTSSLRPYFCRT